MAKKLKTRKAVAKRIRFTGTKKIKIRAGAQDHFNARQTGNKKRNKRRDITLSKVMHHNIKNALPNR
jgi:ribosomal protein L35